MYCKPQNVGTLNAIQFKISSIFREVTKKSEGTDKQLVIPCFTTAITAAIMVEGMNGFNILTRFGAWRNYYSFRMIVNEGYVWSSVR